MAALLSPVGSMAQADSFARVTKLWDENSGPIVPMDIHTACSSGEYTYVKQLLADKTDPNIKNRESWTPLAYASYGGHLKLVSLLIEVGKVDVNARTGPTDMTCLMWAAACNHDVIISTLLKNGARLDDEDSFGQTGLVWAVLTESKNALRALIKYGSNLEHREKRFRRTPLQVAVVERNEAIVDLLLRKGVDLTAVDNTNFSALQLALNPPASTALVNLIENASRKSSHPEATEVAVRSEAGLGMGTLAIDDDDDGLEGMPHTSPPPPHPTTTHQSNITPQFASTEDFLTFLNLAKYIPLFQKENLSFEAVVEMNEAQLRALGLTLFGPRRKIFSAAQRWKEENRV